jgi:hypothetical protein
MSVEPERKRLSRKTYIPYVDPPWDLRCQHLIVRDRAGGGRDSWMCKWYDGHLGRHYAHHHSDPNDNPDDTGSVADAEKSSEEIFRSRQS